MNLRTRSILIYVFLSLSLYLISFNCLVVFDAIAQPNIVQSDAIANSAAKNKETPTSFDVEFSAFDLGIQAYQREQYIKAKNAFDLFLKNHSENAAAYSNRCLSYIQLEDYVAAIADCTQALQFNPNNLEAYLNRGLAHYRLADYGNAIANYDQLLWQQPKDYRAYYNRGLAQFALENYEAAIADYTQSLINCPQPLQDCLAAVYRDRGIAYGVSHRPDLAIADLQQAMDRFKQQGLERGYQETFQLLKQLQAAQIAVG